MDKRSLIIAGSLIIGFSNASANSGVVNVDIEKMMRSEPEVPLTNNEKKSFSKIKKTEKSEDTRIDLPDGTIEYLYGYGIPTVLCRFLDSCAILFEKGENLGKSKSDFFISDGRVQLVPMVDNVGGDTRSMILVSPVQPGVTANLYIRTDRRDYHLVVKSTNNTSYPKVSFRYKKALDRSLEAYHEKLDRIKRREKYDPKNNYDFSYTIKGDEKWRPSRVYFTGKKTVVEFFDDFSLSKRPTLFSVRGDKREFVEYRVDYNRYIVDYKLENAALAIDGKEVLMTHKDYKEESDPVSAFGGFIGDGF